MIVSIMFGLLALTAVGGAVGVLLLRRLEWCIWSFGLTCLALGGIYLLFNNSPAAIIHVMSLFVWGSLLAVNRRVVRLSRSSAVTWWALPIGIMLAVLAGRAALAGRLDTPFIGWPIWATPQDRMVALGQWLLRDYTILPGLLGLVLLTVLVGLAYARRADRQTDREVEIGHHR